MKELAVSPISDVISAFLKLLTLERTVSNSLLIQALTEQLFHARLLKVSDSTCPGYPTEGLAPGLAV